MLHVSDKSDSVSSDTEGQPDVATPSARPGSRAEQVALLPENRCECGCGRTLGVKRRRGPPRRFATGACRQRVYDAKNPRASTRVPRQEVDGFGGAVEFARNRANWSQYELAERLGVSRGWVAHVENNRMGVTAARLREILKLCGTLRLGSMDDDSVYVEG